MNWPQDTVGWLGPLPNPISWLDMYHHCNDDDIDYNYYHNRDEIHNNYDDTRSQEARWAPTFSISNPPTPNCSAGQWSSIDIESVCVCVCHRHSASVTNFNQNISIGFSSKTLQVFQVWSKIGSKVEIWSKFLHVHHHVGNLFSNLVNLHVHHLVGHLLKFGRNCKIIS